MVYCIEAVLNLASFFFPMIRGCGTSDINREIEKVERDGRPDSRIASEKILVTSLLV